MKFFVDDAVVEIGVRGVYLRIREVRNAKSAPHFESYFKQVCDLVWQETSKESIKTDPILDGFRKLHAAVGQANRRNVASSENLLRMLEKNRTLPRVNLLVDIYNLVSIQSRLALGAHDVDKTDGNVTLRMTKGTERFQPLGQTEPQPVNVGEYSYIDDSNEIICRMEVRQVEKTKVETNTRDVFYIVQGNSATPYEDIFDAAKMLTSVTTRFCGGSPSVLYPHDFALN